MTLTTITAFSLALPGTSHQSELDTDLPRVRDPILGSPIAVGIECLRAVLKISRIKIAKSWVIIVT